MGANVDDYTFSVGSSEQQGERSDRDAESAAAWDRIINLARSNVRADELVIGDVIIVSGDICRVTALYPPDRDGYGVSLSVWGEPMTAAGMIVPGSALFARFGA